MGKFGRVGADAGARAVCVHINGITWGIGRMRKGKRNRFCSLSAWQVQDTYLASLFSNQLRYLSLAIQELA